MKYTELNTFAKPYLSLGIDRPVVVKFLSALRTGPGDPKKPQIGPGKIVDVLLLMRGDEEITEPMEFELPLSNVSMVEVERQFPGDKVIGKIFKIIKHAKSAGGKTSPTTVKLMKVEK